ncbi:MAG: KEOPS complex subunit Pcc1 [archaeon]
MSAPYRITLTIKSDRHLSTALGPELAGIREERAKTRLTATDDGVTVTIDAVDATALQAAINAVLKMVRTYEKAKEASE